jgi:predicted alpha-1,2-mannosidase
VRARGHYAVALPGHGVRVELTATRLVALHRWHFTRPGPVQVLVDVQHGLHFVEGPRVQAATTRVDAAGGDISGTVHANNWVERQASFVLRFSAPIDGVTELPPQPGHRAPRYLLSFESLPGHRLEARVALSTVDEAGARNNLAQAEGHSFETVRAEAAALWERLLSRLVIDADARTRRIFHSAVYRALLHPSDIADADGRVRGPRGQVLLAPGGRYDSTLSLWDTFRAVHPLHSLVVPERVPGLVNSLLAHHGQMGLLPLWTVWGRETFTMIGNPALVVLAEAVSKGLVPPAQVPAVLQTMVETSTRPRPDATPWAQRGWDELEQYGYLPFDVLAAQGRTESVSKTLEYALGDDAVARVAASGTLSARSCVGATARAARANPSTPTKPHRP